MLNLEQALASLESLTEGGSLPSELDLLSLITEIDANDRVYENEFGGYEYEQAGDKTLAYTGNTINNESSRTIVRALANSDQSIRIIDDTSVGEFLNSSEFESVVNQIFGDDVQSRDAWLYEAQTGPWAVASDNFASHAVGDVLFFGPRGSVERTFAQIELRRMLINGNVTSIDGIPISELQKLSEIHFGDIEVGDMGRVSQFVFYNSFLKSALSNLDASSPDSINTFLSLEPDSYFDVLKLKPETFAHVNAAFDELNDADHVAGIKSWAASMREFSDQAVDSSGKWLNRLGTVGEVAALLFVVKEASDAYNGGDKVGAKALVEQFAFEASSSAAGAYVGAQVGSIALALMFGGATTVGAPIAFTVVAISAITGGLMGESAGEELYSVYRGYSDSQRLYVVERLSDLFLSLNNTVENFIEAGLNDGNFGFEEVIEKIDDQPIKDLNINTIVSDDWMDFDKESASQNDFFDLAIVARPSQPHRPYFKTAVNTSL